MFARSLSSGRGPRRPRILRNVLLLASGAGCGLGAYHYLRASATERRKMRVAVEGVGRFFRWAISLQLILGNYYTITYAANVYRTNTVRPHQIDLMFHDLLTPKNRPGRQAKKEKKLMNIIIKPHTESQHTTKSHFSKTLQRFARSHGYSDLWPGPLIGLFFWYSAKIWPGKSVKHKINS